MGSRNCSKKLVPSTCPQQYTKYKPVTPSGKDKKLTPASPHKNHPKCSPTLIKISLKTSQRYCVLLFVDLSRMECPAMSACWPGFVEGLFRKKMPKAALKYLTFQSPRLNKRLFFLDDSCKRIPLLPSQSLVKMDFLRNFPAFSHSPHKIP